MSKNNEIDLFWETKVLKMCVYMMQENDNQIFVIIDNISKDHNYYHDWTDITNAYNTKIV